MVDIILKWKHDLHFKKEKVILLPTKRADLQQLVYIIQVHKFQWGPWQVSHSENIIEYAIASLRRTQGLLE